MKIKTALIFLLFPILLFSQNIDYWTKTKADLITLKAEAIKTEDFSNAAKIQNELEDREAEDDELKSLQANLKYSVSVEAFEKAAIYKEEIDKIEKKNELRVKIQNEIEAKNYKEVEKLKNELRILIDPSLTQTTYSSTSTTTKTTPKSPKQSAFDENRQRAAERRYEASEIKSFNALDIGLNAPFGFMSGKLSDFSIGYYFNIRASFHGFVLADEKLVGTKIGDGTGTFSYNNTYHYGRLEGDFGITRKIFGTVDYGALYFYGGLGVCHFRYLYDFDQISSTGTRAEVIVNDMNFSGVNANLELGLIFDVAGVFNLHFGGVIGIPNREQSMISLGIGF